MEAYGIIVTNSDSVKIAELLKENGLMAQHTFLNEEYVYNKGCYMATEVDEDGIEHVHFVDLVNIDKVDNLDPQKDMFYLTADDIEYIKRFI